MAKRTTTTDQPARYLLMTEERSNGYYHLYGRVVTQRYEQGSYRPDGVDDTYSDGPLYSGLQLRCQGDQDSRRGTLDGSRPPAGAVYGYDCEYREVFSVGRREAVRMAKTLTTLDAKLSKLQEQRGYVASYGAYVGRVAEALGCVGIGFLRSATSRETTGERWTWDTPGYGITRIDQLIAAWVDEARPAAAAEVAS